MIEEAQSKGKKVGGSIECIVIHFTCLKSEHLGSVGLSCRKSSPAKMVPPGQKRQKMAAVMVPP